MAKPSASYSFKANGLSVQFTDRSSGIVTSWSWDFNDGLATTQNPLHAFTTAGIYHVTLVATNADGSDSFSFDIVVQTSPSLNQTIKEMVQYDLPTGLAFDSIGFDQLIRKWQLYFQEAAKVEDSNVFDESKWPSLWNVLIDKCIVYDLVLKAATSSMASFIAAAESYNALISKVTTSTIQVADYSVALIQNDFPVVVNLIISDGVSIGPSSSQANFTALLNYLNTLNIGLFNIQGANLVSLGNSKILTTFNYTHNGTGANGAFAQSNARVVSVTQAISSSGGTLGTKGPVKSIETGPSKASWYDSSTFWSNIFKGISGAAGGSGLFAQISAEICTYAKKLKIKMPMCDKPPASNRTFVIAKGRTSTHPPSGILEIPGYPPPFWQNDSW